MGSTESVCDHEDGLDSQRGNSFLCPAEEIDGFVENDGEGCPDDTGKSSAGTCGCGVSDVDSDADGVPDCNDQCPDAPDVDSDADGILDCNDQCPGSLDVDSDGDGTADCNDGCVGDVNKVDAGTCGCGVADTDDTDGDGKADCVDPEPYCRTDDSDDCGVCGGDGSGCVPVSRPSCVGAGLDCDDNGTAVSCCDSQLVVGGTFSMGQGDADSNDYASGLQWYHRDERPEHSAIVSDFLMDTFEVTVGRFRKFVEAFEEGWRPSDGDGAHPWIDGSGWNPEWDGRLPADGSALKQALKCSLSWETWSDEPRDAEQYPINCVSWYEAFAFCAWDGGRLATETEWEYASAGGSENRLYPWGSEDPAGRANHAGSANSPEVDVGSYPAGEARYGQQDLAGSLWEWTLDAYDAEHYSIAEISCRNCANLESSTFRVLRGGSFDYNAESLRAANRLSSIPALNSYVAGLRCVRSR